MISPLICKERQKEPGKGRLTILGSGATGLAAAYHFTALGVRVYLCDTEERAPVLEEVRSAGGIRLCGVCKDGGPLLPADLDHNFAAAMAHSNRVLVCAAANRQRLMAERCAPYVTPEHSFLLSPGNFGALELRAVLGAEVQLGELSDNLWPCRMAGPARILLGLPLGSKRVSAFPSADTPALMERWGDLLQLQAGANVIETALNSPNVISHVAGAVLNAAAVEQKRDDFAFFRDGLSPAVLRVLQAVELERNHILTWLGLRPYQETMPLLNALLEGTPPGFEVFRELDGPMQMEHRYITEDARCGVSLLLSIAREYNLSVPVTAAAMTLAECINGTAYLSQGRTLSRYGLAGRSKEELLHAI